MSLDNKKTMGSKLKFRKGDFITQNSCPNSFAIFGGDVYEPVEEGAGEDYSLICYYNPAHYDQDSNGNWIRQSVFEYDLGTTEVCEYTINEHDMMFWRCCTESEKDKALQTLATKKLAWIENTYKFRKLGVNEQLMFGDPKNTGDCGGNVRHGGANTNPYYNPNAYNRNTTTAPKRKTITRIVDDDWEQKEPIATMTEEHKVLVLKQCEKLKYAFNSYSYGSDVSVPRRGGFSNYMSYGMCALASLMEGDCWGYYND